MDSNRFSNFIYKMKHSKFHDRIKNIFLYRESHENIKNTLKEIYSKEENEKIRTLDHGKLETIEKAFIKNFSDDVKIFDLSQVGDKFIQ